MPAAYYPALTECPCGRGPDACGPTLTDGVELPPSLSLPPVVRTFS